MNRKTLTALAAVALLMSAGFCYLFFLLGAPVSVSPPVVFEITPGEPASAVVDRLASEGVIRSPRVFLLMARSNRMDRSFRHGVHEFSGALTPERVLEELVRPPRAAVRITIPEGLTWRAIGRLLEENDIVAAEDYYAAVCAPPFLALTRAAPEANCAEGFLFPDTYDLTPGMSAEQIARLQLRHFELVMADLLVEPAGRERESLVEVAAAEAASPANSQLEDLSRIVTLASVVEKETSVAAERGLVSSVFHNRLQRGMRLQADPTVIYGLTVSGSEWDGQGLHKHLREPTPYNSYTNDGLPPGPICNPGREALRAALRPDETNFLYFVAAGDGSHTFSSTLQEHNRAVARLRTAIKGRKP